MSSRNLTSNFIEFRNRAIRNQNLHADNKIYDDHTPLIQDEDEDVVHFERDDSLLWIEFHRKIQLQFDKVRKQIKSLQQLHDKRLRRHDFDDDLNKDEEMELLTKDITSMLNNCRVSVQQFSSLTRKSHENSYDRHLISNAAQATTNTLQDLLLKFSQCQTTYFQSKSLNECAALFHLAIARTRFELNSRSIYGCSYIATSPCELKYKNKELQSQKENFNQMMPHVMIDMNANPFGDKEFDQISLLSEVQQQSTPQIDEYSMQRDKEIRDAYQSMNEVNSIFGDIATMVVHQKTNLDQIECVVHDTVNLIEQGNVQLVKAVQRQTRFLKIKLMFIGIGIFILLFVFLTTFLS
ncbi:hypothetical protein I4U23_025369 [Adineta vaga]|nr:hypothetical protein I4U23_025369 [Adineta vaga]